jgi:hypothetical protein
MHWRSVGIIVMPTTTAAVGQRAAATNGAVALISCGGIKSGLVCPRSQSHGVRTTA